MTTRSATHRCKARPAAQPLPSETSWGVAGNWIGQRWETVATQALLARRGTALALGETGRFVLEHLVPIDTDPQLRSVLHAAGRCVPDAVLVGAVVAGDHDCRALLPIDFMYSVTAARRRQLDAEQFRVLCRKAPALLLPRLAGPLGTAPAATAARLADETLAILPGRIVCPATWANRQAQERAGQSPLKHAAAQATAILLSYDPQVFFAGLPHAGVGTLLRDRDGVIRTDGATLDRYYRLGVRAVVALSVLACPLFDRPPPGVTTPSLAALTGARPGRDAQTLVQDLERQASARRALVARLAALDRACPYTVGELAHDLQQPSQSPAVRAAYTGLIRRYRDLLRARGRALRAAGASVTDALDQIEVEAHALARQARDDGLAWAA